MGKLLSKAKGLLNTNEGKRVNKQINKNAPQPGPEVPVKDLPEHREDAKDEGVKQFALGWAVVKDGQKFVFKNKKDAEAFARKK